MNEVGHINTDDAGCSGQKPQENTILVDLLEPKGKGNRDGYLLRIWHLQFPYNRQRQEDSHDIQYRVIYHCS